MSYLLHLTLSAPHIGFLSPMHALLLSCDCLYATHFFSKSGSLVGFTLQHYNTKKKKKIIADKNFPHLKRALHEETSVKP